MSKNVIAVNCSPRIGWNTETLVKEAAKGAEDSGVRVTVYNIYQLDSFQGCRSCFACKRSAHYGKCVYKDGLSEVLESIRQADGLILGSPNYLGDLSAGFRALYERLVFQFLTYNKEVPCCNEHKIPILLITTSNCEESYYKAVGYDKMLKNYQDTLTNFVGNTEIFICGNTKQVNDYSQFNWTLFDAETKYKQHEEVFPEVCKEIWNLSHKMFVSGE